MSICLDLDSHGYQIERVLGQNRSGGRITYKATQTDTQHPVVIKQFQFAVSDASWSGYNAHQSELQMLRSLSHPCIPRYLESFETPNGFCLVQEYKRAVPLTQLRHVEPQEVKQIALAVLHVLAFLQRRNPPIIHRDIKPENILVDRSSRTMKVYLVDFGFARLGSGEVAGSSTVKGTVGFMPPEQLFRRELTEASDLYSLGATLICLLTKTKSTDIGQLIDERSRLQFRSLLPKLNPQFVNWLDKMVALNLKSRYPNAAAALKALQPIDVTGKAISISRMLNLNSSQLTVATTGAATVAAITILGIAMVATHQKSMLWRLLNNRDCPTCTLPGTHPGRLPQ